MQNQLNNATFDPLILASSNGPIALDLDDDAAMVFRVVLLEVVCCHRKINLPEGDSVARQHV